MRATVFLLLFTVMSVALQAQESPPRQSPTPTQTPPHGVAIVKFSWRKERIPGWENNRFGPVAENYEAMRERVINERRIQQARNAGNKAEVSRRETNAKMHDDANYQKEAKPQERPRDGYRYKVQIRNDGDKTIKLIDWDYVFVDPQTQKEVARHLFTSEEKLKPGAMKELGVFILAPPTPTIRAHEAQKGAFPFTEQVVLARVVYSDGTVWEQR